MVSEKFFHPAVAMKLSHHDVKSVWCVGLFSQLLKLEENDEVLNPLQPVESKFNRLDCVTL